MADCKQQKKNVVEGLYLNVSQSGEEILKVKNASVEVQKRDPIARKCNGRNRREHKHKQ